MVNAGFDAESQSESDWTDTTDQDQVSCPTLPLVSTLTSDLQAVDIDELLSPGHPVFFNYASVQPAKAPVSLKVPPPPPSPSPEHIGLAPPSLQGLTSASEADSQRKTEATCLKSITTLTRYTTHTHTHTHTRTHARTHTHTHTQTHNI